MGDSPVNVGDPRPLGVGVRSIFRVELASRIGLVSERSAEIFFLWLCLAGAGRMKVVVGLLVFCVPKITTWTANRRRY